MNIFTHTMYNTTCVTAEDCAEVVRNKILQKVAEKNQIMLWFKINHEIQIVEDGIVVKGQYCTMDEDSEGKIHTFKHKWKASEISDENVEKLSALNALYG